MNLPTMLPGPFALDVHDGHEWATFVAIYGPPDDLWLRWHGGHEHVCEVVGGPVVDGQRLVVTTAEHGQLVLRPIDASDDWLVFGDAGRTTAWQAAQRGML